MIPQGVIDAVRAFRDKGKGVYTDQYNKNAQSFDPINRFVIAPIMKAGYDPSTNKMFPYSPLRAENSDLNDPNAMMNVAGMVGAVNATRSVMGAVKATQAVAGGVDDVARLGSGVAKATPKTAPLNAEAPYRSPHQIIGDVRSASDLNNIDEIVQQHKVTNGYITKFDQKDLYKLKKMQGNPGMEVKIYRASPVNELNKGDWITTSKTYAQDIKKQNGGKVYEYTAKASDLKYPNDISELPSLARFSAFKYEPSLNKAQPPKTAPLNKPMKR